MKKIPYNEIRNEDCLETMVNMPNNYIDLTVTSPPYDNLRTYNGYSFDFESIAKELFRVTKKGGVLVWIIGDATVKGSETGTSFKQALFFKECGFNLHDTMIWSKPNAMPTQSTRYQQGFEFMFVFTKGKLKAFNPIKTESKCKGTKVKKHRAKTDGHNYNEEGYYIVSDEKMIDNVWSIANVKNKTNHKAIFPEQLANDHIISWSNEGDIVYDPFMGSGTTAKMAKLNNRNYVGSEISEEYCEITDKRINDIGTLF
jgi:site-specific DNA-methyltransferase (adenine-specific)